MCIRDRDKALVENAVKLLYRSVYLDVEGMTFTSLDELNTWAKARFRKKYA